MDKAKKALIEAVAEIEVAKTTQNGPVWEVYREHYSAHAAKEGERIQKEAVQAAKGGK